MPANQQYDVVVIGAGIAGLTLARQLKRADPRLRILVADKRPQERPEAASPCGEPLSTIAAHYLADVLGLHAELQQHHARSTGTRFFLSAAGNRDIASRPEIAASVGRLLPTYHVDRERLLNVLIHENAAMGVDQRLGCTVERVVIRRGRHETRVTGALEARDVTSRWLVDASGNIGVLTRQLDLRTAVPHHMTNVSLHAADRILVDEWTNDARWRASVPSEVRRRGVSYFIGSGYWLRFTPLAASSTFVTIVAHPSFHSFHEMSRLDRLLDWMRRYEPQCARALAEQRSSLHGFQARRRRLAESPRLFSPDGWAITGDAGVAVDPLYSRGVDAIAIVNGFIVDLIARRASASARDARVHAYNRLCLSLLRLWHGHDEQYGVLGRAPTMAMKLLWDTAVYASVHAALYGQGTLTKGRFMASLSEDLRRVIASDHGMQATLREWGSDPSDDQIGALVDLGSLDRLTEVATAFVEPHTDHVFRQRVHKMIQRLESFAGDLERHRVPRTGPSTVADHAVRHWPQPTFRRVASAF